MGWGRAVGSLQQLEVSGCNTAGMAQVWSSMQCDGKEVEVRATGVVPVVATVLGITALQLTALRAAMPQQGKHFCLPCKDTALTV